MKQHASDSFFFPPLKTNKWSNSYFRILKSVWSIVHQHTAQPCCLWKQWSRRHSCSKLSRCGWISVSWHISSPVWCSGIYLVLNNPVILDLYFLGNHTISFINKYIIYMIYENNKWTNHYLPEAGEANMKTKILQPTVLMLSCL